MRYPTTWQYIESISNPEALFRTLRGIRGRGEELCFSSGSYGTVFSVERNGKPYALKCFTRHQPGRAEAYKRIETLLNGGESQSDCDSPPYLVPFRWLEDELTVFDDTGAPAEQSVLLMDWVEGRSLTDVLEKGGYRKLSEAFDRLAVWLLDQPFAHGDLKPDNIMVRGDADLVLIDYDGIYLPDMEGERARENGTEGFRHPRRDETSYGKWIDDYSIALLSLSLRALARWPELYGRFHEPGYLIFRPELILQGVCPAYRFLRETELTADPLFAVLEREKDAPVAGLREMLAGELVPVASRPEPSEYHAREITKRGYEEYVGFSEGLAAVRKGRKWGYLDENLNEVIGFRYEDAWSFRGGRGLVKYRGRYGYVGLEKRGMVIPARYDFAQSFREGAACVMVDGLYGYIGPKGRWLIRPMFDYARPKRDGKVYVEIQGKGREIEI